MKTVGKCKEGQSFDVDSVFGWIAMQCRTSTFGRESPPSVWRRTRSRELNG